jgi:hypothetical protein
MAAIRTSTSAVGVTAFWAIAVLGAAVLPMTDPDTWWHIRVGREILDAGAIPSVDTWSLAGAGRPWVSQDWASNILLALLYVDDTWGPTLVSLAYGAMVVASMGLLWNAIGVRVPAVGWLARSAWLLVGLVLAAPVLGGRVQVVDLLLTAATVNVLWRHLAQPRSWHLVALPLIALAWVNLHAGWPLLFLIGGAIVVGEAVDTWLRRAAEAAPASVSRLARLSLSLALAAVALSANPNGPAIYAYPFDTLEIGALSAFVGEWQPASLDLPAGQLLALFVVAAVAPALLLARRLRTADVLVLLGLTFMAVTAVRFVLVAGPIGAAVVCLAVAPAVSATSLGRSTDSLIARTGGTPRGPRGAVNGVLAVLVLAIGVGLVAARITPAAQDAAISERFPVDAVNWMNANEPGSRMFNHYEWGGYLGLQRPGSPIFIDGRADVYGDEIIREYVEVISTNDDPAAYFDRYAIDHVVYPTGSTLAGWLEASDGWRTVYDDEVASIWARSADSRPDD